MVGERLKMGRLCSWQVRHLQYDFLQLLEDEDTRLGIKISPPAASSDPDALVSVSFKAGEMLLEDASLRGLRVS